MCLCACVTPRRRALFATRGPCCRLPPSPRILSGASHTWVAHSSWALHIQIAVMNIIREEQRGDVWGTHTHTLICEGTNTYVSTQTNVCMKYIVVHTKHDHSYKHVNQHVQYIGETHTGACPINTFPRALSEHCSLFQTWRVVDTHTFTQETTTHTNTYTHLSWCQTLNFHPGAQFASPYHFKYRPASSHGTSLNLSDGTRSDYLLL